MSKSKKAEQRALEAYPVLMCYNDFRMVKEDINKPLREIYQDGYQQAEKDLELTWEDLATIDKLGDDFVKKNHTPMSDEEFYKEVLKRFKDLKNK